MNETHQKHKNSKGITYMQEIIPKKKTHLVSRRLFPELRKCIRDTFSHITVILANSLFVNLSLTEEHKSISFFTN